MCAYVAAIETGMEGSSTPLLVEEALSSQDRVDTPSKDHFQEQSMLLLFC